MKWDTKTKEKIQYITAGVCMAVGVCIVITDFILPPLALIHNTSLYLLGEFITFVSAIFGINLHYSNQLEKFKETMMEKNNEEIDGN